MKPEFKFKGTEATPADYAQLMQALLASQAATPTARACHHEDAAPAPQSILDALFGEGTIGAGTALSGGQPITEKDGNRAVYPRVSGFLEADESNSSASRQSPNGTAGRSE